jgi:hypothetical protein
MRVGSTVLIRLHEVVKSSPISVYFITDYSVGSRIRVKLYTSKIIEAEITVITNQSAGRNVQIVYGSVTASINPAQITEVLPTT